mmetsp:Transcript_25741/g.52853  ORF Transcript_25741/g.52853 Transcript_25741/m.52853 type:complete len:108 (+) Transcript_25741:805-1128(+)
MSLAINILLNKKPSQRKNTATNITDTKTATTTTTTNSQQTNKNRLVSPPYPQVKKHNSSPSTLDSPWHSTFYAPLASPFPWQYPLSLKGFAASSKDDLELDRKLPRF